MPHFWKPAFVTQRGGITSVDIHPDGTRFATAGVDGKVMIWQLAPLIDKSYDEKEYEPLLSVLQNHTSAVNIVRWSPDGRLLASGGDDKAVILWELRPGAATSVKIADNDTFVPSENWQAKAVMTQGHHGDILDLCWSPDGTKIATASIDNAVSIWDVATQRIYKTMEKHTAHVKGVAWDPLGRYLASVGDDKTLVMWKTSDYVVEAEIKSPFRKAPANIMYKRMSWSPDGQVLVASGAVKNGKDIATIVGRKDWNTDKEFVGHSLPVSAARFSPCFYLDDSKKGIRMICALGGQDSNVSLWMTDRPRALAAVTNMFGQVITDLSWTLNGAILLMSSLDGTLGVIQFNDDEVGQRLTSQEANNHMMGLYGDVYTSAVAANSSLIEDPTLLDLAGSASRSSAPATKPFVAPAVVARPAPSAPVDNSMKPTTRVIQSVGNANVVTIETGAGSVEQIVTSTKTGKKRIQPLSLNQNAEVSTPLQTSPVPAFPAAPVSPAPAMGPPAPVTPTASSLASSLSPVFRSEAFPALAGMQPSINKKRKRGDDIATGLASRDESSDSDDESVRRRHRKKRRVRDDDSDSDVMEEQTDRSNPFGYAAVRQGSRPRRSPTVLIRPPTLGAAGTRFVRECKVKGSDILPFTLSAELITASSGADRSAPAAANERPSMLALEVTHAEEPLIGQVSFVSCLADSVVLWKDRLKTQVCVAAVCPSYCAVGSLSGELQLYSAAGRRIMTGMVLGSAICFLEFSSNSPHLAAICSDGQFHLWNVELMVLEMSGSVSPLLTSSSSAIGRIRLWSDALVVILSNGDSFSFSPNLKCWTRIHDQQSFIASNFWAPNRLTGTPGPIHELMAEATSKSRILLAQVASTSEQSRIMETIAHLEATLSAAEQLNSSEEYKTWFKAYIRQLTEITATARLEELFADLLGPSHASESTPTWNANVAGISKRALLHDALPIIASNIRLQRLATKYREGLELLQKRA